MVFSSLVFLFLFFPIVLLVNLILPKKAQNYWLFFSSIFFYAWGAHEFAIVMIASIALNYCFAIKIHENSENMNMRKFWLIISICMNLGILFYNKYMNFFTQNLARILGNSVIVTDIMLPIGISFFTFQAISYVVDVYRENVEVQRNPFYLGLYIAFFPQLIAGPIVRYHTIAQQIENRTTTIEQFQSGAVRFMGGFASKVIFANSFSVVADKAFSFTASSELSVGLAWLGALCYTLQIFFDFSGYSMMAIGLGKMFGFEFMENFNYPYISRSLSEFWRRWHISLGQFFRDYVYFPLGGSRVSSNALLLRNLFFVWLLTGIWHGASWNFIVWGLVYFLLLSIEKICGIPRINWNLVSRGLYQLFTLLAVIFGWVLFRASNLLAAVMYVKAMFGATGNEVIDENAIRYTIDYGRILVLSLFFATPVAKKITQRIETCDAGQIIVFIGYTIAFLFAISSLVMGGNNPFIYFNF